MTGLLILSRDAVRDPSRVRLGSAELSYTTLYIEETIHVGQRRQHDFDATELFFAWMKARNQELWAQGLIKSTETAIQPAFSPHRAHKYCHHVSEMPCTVNVLVIIAMLQLVGGEEEMPANRLSPFHQDRNRPSGYRSAIVPRGRQEHLRYISMTHSLPG